MNQSGFSPSIKFDNLFEAVISFLKQNGLNEFGGFNVERLEAEAKKQRDARREYTEAEQVFLSKKDAFRVKQADRYQEFSVLLKMLKARFGKDPNFQSVIGTFIQRKRTKRKNILEEKLEVSNKLQETGV